MLISLWQGLMGKSRNQKYQKIIDKNIIKNIDLFSKCVYYHNVKT